MDRETKAHLQKQKIKINFDVPQLVTREEWPILGAGSSHPEYKSYKKQKNRGKLSKCIGHALQLDSDIDSSIDGEDCWSVVRIK
jgi:hypothetical protein